MTLEREAWLRVVGESLRGSRRSRRRLLAEIEGHLEDAAAEEVAAGRTPPDAEAVALRRLGAPTSIAADWNADTRARRSAVRVRIVVLVILVGAFMAPVALAQRSGTSHRSPEKLVPAKIKQERGDAPARAS